MPGWCGNYPEAFLRVNRWLHGVLARTTVSEPSLAELGGEQPFLGSRATAEEFPKLQVMAISTARASDTADTPEADYPENLSVGAISTFPFETNPPNIIRCWSTRAVTLDLQPRATAAPEATARGPHQSAFDWARDHLDYQGHALFGRGSIGGSSSRYCVYSKAEGRLFPVEFGFSLDCLAPFNPLDVRNVDNDPSEIKLRECLAHLGTDKSFTQAFQKRVRQLTLTHKFRPSTARTAASLASADLAKRTESILLALGEEHWVDSAAGILARQAGATAYRNEIGDLAVKWEA